jgi:hypothetical protein
MMGLGLEVLKTVSAMPSGQSPRVLLSTPRAIRRAGNVSAAMRPREPPVVSHVLLDPATLAFQHLAVVGRPVERAN